MKWYGTIGYADNIEVEPGVWEDDIVEKKYYGDIVKSIRRLQDSSEINKSVNISNRISIIADPYAMDNIYKMRYATFGTGKWIVSDVEIVSDRRIELTLGGIWNGQ